MCQILSSGNSIKWAKRENWSICQAWYTFYWLLSKKDLQKIDPCILLNKVNCAFFFPIIILIISACSNVYLSILYIFHQIQLYLYHLLQITKLLKTQAKPLTWFKCMLPSLLPCSPKLSAVASFLDSLKSKGNNQSLEEHYFTNESVH